MSKIIRGIQADKLQTHTIAIPFHTELQNNVEDQSMIEEQSNQLTLQDVLNERNRLLEEARFQITQERAQFELFQQEQLTKLDELKAIWEEEKLQLEQQAYEEAFSRGYEEGIQKASSQMAESIKITNEMMDLARVNADKYIEEQENVILHLALTCAEKIIGQELKTSEETFVSIIKRGLKEVRDLPNIKVFVSNEHYATISKYRDELAELFPPDVQFLIFVNDDLVDYQCYIESNHGRVIVSYDEQLQELKGKLQEILDSKE